MTMDQLYGFENALVNYNNSNAMFNQATLSFVDPDIDWSVLENADQYLLRDDSAWITRLSKNFWWNLERISEMITTTENNYYQQQQINSKKHTQQQNLLSSMQSNGNSTRKIIGQRTTIAPPNKNNIPMKTNSSSYDHDIDYNPFQSKIAFDNSVWTNYSQNAIPWQ